MSHPLTDSRLARAFKFGLRNPVEPPASFRLPAAATRGMSRERAEMLRRAMWAVRRVDRAGVEGGRVGAEAELAAIRAEVRG